MEVRNFEAVALLERYLKDWADDSLHVKLAQVFATTNMMQDSLSHYQAALRINPLNEAAKKGLERLEKQMKKRRMLMVTLKRPSFCDMGQRFKIGCSSHHFFRLHIYLVICVVSRSSKA